MLLLGNEGKIWYEAPCCGFRVDVLGGFWVVTFMSWWALDGCYMASAGCCYFLVGPGWLLLFLDGSWMVTVIFWQALDGQHEDCTTRK